MSKDIVAKYWSSTANTESKEMVCELCPHFCKIANRKSGKCGVRTNKNGLLIAGSYGKATSIALDPIEKKPLYKFHSGKKIVSIGGYGCNFNCLFCQNYHISMEYKTARFEIITPEIIKLVALESVSDTNVGVAYTYNEPLIGYEFVLNCSKLIKEVGLVNVLVTNGYINKEPLDELLPYIDAMNIDIKGMREGTYNKVGGTLKPVMDTIEVSNSRCHVEVTTLVIPDENEDEIEEIAKWLSQIDPQIPYHLSRFYPRYKYSNHSPTPHETMHKLHDTASKHLKNVYLGNM